MSIFASVGIGPGGVLAKKYDLLIAPLSKSLRRKNKRKNRTISELSTKAELPKFRKKILWENRIIAKPTKK